jgi:pimeloyl-ACP methyl ester carboxylesterase
MYVSASTVDLMNQGIFRPFRCALAVIATFALVVVTAHSTTGSAEAAPAPSYEVFTGSVADFYQVPDPLVPGPPGELIRVQTITSTAAATTMRIMYHSVDGAGRDRAVTGKITFPTASPPPGGWPVMSLANGTVGLAPQCAPSRGSGSLYDFGIGGVSVASDYIGEGPIGEVQAYLSRPSEGHSVLDAVRAARNLAEAHAGSRFVVLGGSQGGHGALSANELAQSYAPELDLLGTVSLAPAAMFDRTYGPLDEAVTRVVTAMGMVGLSTEHPEIDLADYANAAGLAAFAQMKTECRNDIITTVLGVEGGIFTNDPRTTEPARSIMLANDVGHVAAPSPVLLVQGTEDWTVSPLRTADLFDRMCDAGQVTEYLSVPGADHDTVTSMAIDQIEAWLAARFAGDTAPDSCLDRSPATTTTTVTPTTSAPTTSAPAPSSPASSVATTVVEVAAGDRSNGSGHGSLSAGHAGELAATGSPVAPLGAAALASVAVGSVLVAAERRRLRRR